MKKYKDVSKAFYGNSDVVRFLQLEDIASQTRNMVREDGTKYLYKHVAIQAEKWRLENEPDEQVTEDWIREHSGYITDLLTDNLKDMVTMFLWLQDVFYEDIDVNNFVEDNADDIAKEYHVLFDD